MFKHLKRTVFNVVVFSITVACLVCFSLFAIGFSSIFYILIGGTLGLVFYALSLIKKKQGETSLEKEDNASEEDKR